MLAEKFNSYFVISTSRSTKSILSVVLGLLKVNPVDETVTLISHYHLNKVVARDFQQSRKIQWAKFMSIYTSNRWRFYFIYFKWHGFSDTSGKQAITKWINMEEFGNLHAQDFSIQGE